MQDFPRNLSRLSHKLNMESERNDSDNMTDREQAKLFGLSIVYQVSCAIEAEAIIAEQTLSILEAREREQWI